MLLVEYLILGESLKKDFSKSSQLIDKSIKQLVKELWEKNINPKVDKELRGIAEEIHEKVLEINEDINSKIKEKDNGKIVVLDETLLKTVTFENWEGYYSIEYILSIKGITTRIDLSEASESILAVTHSQKRNKLSVKLKNNLSESEVDEIRKKTGTLLYEKLGRKPEIKLNTVFTKKDFFDTRIGWLEFFNYFK